MTFTPRLIQILILLLNAKEPIPAAELAKQLQISKRTIFREIDSVDKPLKQYGLVFNRKSRNGFELVGSKEEKEALLTELKQSDYFDPRNREKRQQKLILAVMKENTLQKAYYYAELLKVSEATISNDMEAVEDWFGMQDITVVRRSGVGIGLEYKEVDYRKALLAYQLQYQDLNIPGGELLEQIRSLCSQEPVIQSLTGVSAESFFLYTAISVRRAGLGHCVEMEALPAEAEQEEQYQFVKRLAKRVEKEFHVILAECEIRGLYIFLKGCKLQYIQTEAGGHSLEKIVNMKALVYEMASRFEPAWAHELVEDEQFVEGLTAHLQPTLTRLMHHIPINNPMNDQIREQYPEIYAKAREASHVLEHVTGRIMPQDEIGFLTIHFGAAMLRLDNRKRPRHRVNIGVVCASGIGISILLSSKLEHHFEDKIRVKVIKLHEVEKSQVDFLVSTIHMDTEIPNICVGPMLGNEDMNRVSALIEEYAFKAKKSTEEKNGTSVYEMTLITGEINAILTHFGFHRMSAGISFQNAAKKISMILGKNPEKAGIIYTDFLKREALSSQVLEEFEIVFLHARTMAVDESRYIVVLPEGPYFTDSYFKKARAVIVMLIPTQDQRNVMAISRISSKLFEDEVFLEEIKGGQENVVTQKNKDILDDYFNEYLQQSSERKY